ncbi:MAG TPA: tannase/feruloyl esterase family alpha/beta hydrolase [Gammaproteobacteria bacterium]
MKYRMTVAALAGVFTVAACDRAQDAGQPSATAAAPATPAQAPTPCENLASLVLPGTTITTGTMVAAGAFTPPGAPQFGPPVDYSGLPAFCRVAATLSPVPDSEIKFEVWMPAQGWNGKFMGTGNGGAAGAVFHFAMAEPLSAGYAVANTDTGHEGGPADWSFAVGHPEKLIDSGYRAVHEMTLQAKAIVAAHYGTAPTRSYWSGCSTGGRQGLVEAQRFPEDYDGIAAGAPASPWVPLMLHSLIAEQVMTDPAGALPPAKLPLIREAAIAACDAQDDVTDRVTTDPERCDFDPGVLACTGSDTSMCLTSREVEAVRKVYRGPVNPRTGEQIAPGPMPGSELEWAAYTPAAFPIASNFMRDIVFEDPDFDLFTFDFDDDVARARQAVDAIFDASNPDLSAFAARGGKLLLWHGWTDGLIPTRGTINYYDSVVATLGADTAADHVRLFLAPGVNHCQGGDGPSIVDYAAALDRWVESGTAPESIVASRPLDEGGTRTRPLCAYPEIARYKGTGDTDGAASFECTAP